MTNTHQHIKKVYITKKIRTQYLYWKILILTGFTASIVFCAVDTYTKNYIGSLQSPVSSLVHHTLKVETAHAETLASSTSPTTVKVVGETPEQLIRRIAKEENFKWPDYLVKLAKCESLLDPKWHNTFGNYPVGSIDRGLFQINDYWHKEVTEAQALNPEWATHWTIKQINNGKQSEWGCNDVVLKKPHKIKA